MSSRTCSARSPTRESSRPWSRSLSAPGRRASPARPRTPTATCRTSPPTCRRRRRSRSDAETLLDLDDAGVRGGRPVGEEDRRHSLVPAVDLLDEPGTLGVTLDVDLSERDAFAVQLRLQAP